LGASTYACTSSTPPAVKAPEKCKLQIINMTVLAGNRLNPTEFGEPRPVQLRIYQMKTDARFNFAEFQDIWKNDQKTLGDDNLSMQELSIYPDSRTEVRFERDESALNLVAVALFRNPSGRTWWTSFDLPPAPGKGDCMASCADGSCDGGTPLNPHFVVWLDGTRVDDGEDHLDDYPDGQWPRMVNAKISPQKAAERGEK
jgi:type VI secretion system protein VasD